MDKKKNHKGLKLVLINERFMTSVLKVLSSNTTLQKRFLSNIEYLLELIDIDYYSKDINLNVLLQAIKISIKHRQKTVIFNLDDLIGEIQVLIPDTFNEQKKNIIIPTLQLGYKTNRPSEIEFVNRIIDIYLKYAAIILTKDKMSTALTDVTSGSMDNLEKSINKYRSTIESISEEFRKTDSLANNKIVNSIDEDFIDILMETYDEVKNPKYTLKTGLKMFNSMLSEEGGFKQSCYYIFYAQINSFKSAILQYCEKWIRKYNSEAYLKMFNETGMIPTILYYSFENTRNENMQREFYMETGTQLKDIGSKDEAKRLWQEHYNSTGSIINVAYMYEEVNSVKVSDMRRQIHALNDSGFKVIAVIIDYLELIRPEDEDIHLENRLKLGYISNSLHVMAIVEDVTVITAQQMNRAAESTIADLRAKGQTNIIEQMGGMQFIGESYAIEKPADMSMYIGLERSIFDNKLYLTVKAGKCRYQKGDVKYFVNELKNGFYIKDDYGTNETLSKPAIMPSDTGEEPVEITERVSKSFEEMTLKPKKLRGSKKEKEEPKLQESEIDLIESIISNGKKGKNEISDENYKEVSKFVPEENVQLPKAA